MDYRKTLNLPKTSFKMKANLAQKEPMYLKRWDREKLYHKLQEHTAGRPLYVLHDGPPYANGHIHLGTAFNKVLKDIICKSRRMAGFHAPYIPGWDCHGLPIEHNVDKELGDKKSRIGKLAKRRACRKYAEKWIKIQKKEFQRLGVLGDWENPYLTMNFGYEATIAREFNRFLLSGSVVRSKKPVYWCSTCRTALAEAEVEYEDHTSPSIYVKFPLVDDLGDTVPELAGERIFVLIWTTTPWTLPANMAIAFHPDFVYAAVRVNGEIWILAEELVEKAMAEFGIKSHEIVATFAARVLEHKKCRHPFLDRDSLLVLADYVTAESGTGCVHTAPGHGADDYLTGLRYGLEILSPVDDDGRFTSEAGPYAGEQVPEVNTRINSDLQTAGALVRQSDINHSYPHCWRCKQPVIYRATAQWFISMEKNDLRTRALEEIHKVSWTPAWGMQRIYGMVESRPDWCLSRQRSWGVPITVLSCSECGEIIRDETVCRRIEESFEKQGADAWFEHEAADFLEPGTSCGCGSTSFRKEDDILDVWFDSGVSHAAVCEAREELRSPADLYLEGSDQHRGWFQSSLLTSVGTRQRAPYRGVLTHGYVVDGQGRKMSKSVGNVVAPQEVIDQYGAEILRLWVSSEDYRDDVKVSDEILRQISDAYRKIRNTIRFLLGNLSDYEPASHRVELAEMSELDHWALARFEEFRAGVLAGYEAYEFHSIFHGLYNFCGTTMSNIYLDVIKDRLYTSPAGSKGRRAAQTVLHTILDGLIRLMAPILSFTAAEAWEHLHGLPQNHPLEESIFFADFPSKTEHLFTEESERRWEKLLAVRGEILQALESARREKVIGHPLEAEVLILAGGELGDFLAHHWRQLAELAIVSALGPVDDPDDLTGITHLESATLPGLVIGIRPAPGEKCERCWIRSPTVGASREHPTICRRCRDVVETMELGR